MTVEMMDKLAYLVDWHVAAFFAAALGENIGKHITDKYVALDCNFIRLWGYLDSQTKKQLIDYVNKE